MSNFLAEELFFSIVYCTKTLNYFVYDSADDSEPLYECETMIDARNMLAKHIAPWITI